MELGQVITSPNDANSYRAIQLTNGLRALLISDGLPKWKRDSGCEDGSGANERLSAAGLCIGVGSFSDPPDIPGLAHFLEHMVFMGSEKYSDENDFDNYIKQHGGLCNAATGCERTTFYFDISKEHFYDGLDRFAQFFIKPLMKRDSVEREVKAVDSEFEMNRTSDGSRKGYLLSMLAREGHPAGKFTTGNTKTLKTIPAEQGIDVYSRLQEFHKRAYSAHYMTLAVQSLVDLDTLQNWVTEIFSAVPNNGLSQPTFKDQKDPFDPDKFYRLYKAIPVKNIHQVELCWALPSMLHEYRKIPLSYLGFLIDHEGEGSLSSYLKKTQWILSVSGGVCIQDSTASIFSITVTLTLLGMDHLQEVIAVVFQYLDMLRREGPKKRIFDEAKTIADNSFRWQEQCEPYGYVKSLCKDMHFYPVEHYITGSELLYDYDPELIVWFTEQLAPRNANVLFFSKKMGECGGCNLREPWYQVQYEVEDIPVAWLDAWENLDPLPELHLPEENAYIASDFALKEPDIEESQYPQLITNTDQSRLWYKKDTLFKVPKAYIHFFLKSPVVRSTALSEVLLDLFVAMLGENLEEVTYAAGVAQLSYSVSGDPNGLVVELNGFNDKLPKLFEVVVDHIVDFKADGTLFTRMREMLWRSYYSSAIDPNCVATGLRLSLLQHPRWSLVAVLGCLEFVTLEDLMAFVHQVKSELFVEGYIHGNVTAQEAWNLERHLLNKLGCDGRRKAQIIEIRVRELPVGDSCVRVENFNTNDNNSVIEHYFQHGPGNLRDTVLNALLGMRMEEPCFAILRTRLQLGYIVDCTGLNTAGIIGFSILICTQANKFTMAELSKRMDDFLTEFKGMLSNTTQEEFDILVRSLINLKKCQDSCMGDEVSRNWSEIFFGGYLFDRRPKQIAILEKLKLEHLQEWLNRLVPDDKQYRRLSVQVVGNPVATTENKESGEEGEVSTDLEDWDRIRQYHFLPLDDTDGAILDIQVFCDSRPLFPVSKIL